MVGTDASSAGLKANGSWSEAASTLLADVDEPKMNFMGDSSLDTALAGGDPARPLPLVGVFPGAFFVRVKALLRLCKGLFTRLGSEAVGAGVLPAFEGGFDALDGVPEDAASALVEMSKGAASATRGVGDQFMGLPTGVPGVGCSDGSTSAWAAGLAGTGPGVVGSLMTASTEEPFGTGAGLLIGVAGGRRGWPLPRPPIRTLILGCLGGLQEFLELGVAPTSAVASPKGGRLGMLAAALGWTLCASLATSVSDSKEEEGGSREPKGRGWEKAACLGKPLKTASFVAFILYLGAWGATMAVLLKKVNPSGETAVVPLAKASSEGVKGPSEGSLARGSS